MATTSARLVAPERGGEGFVDALEDLVDAARLRPVAVLEVIGARARHLEQRALERADRVGHGDLGRGPREAIAARLAARGRDQAGATKVTDQLLQVGVGKPLALRDGGQRQAGVVLAESRQRDEDPDAVLGARADLHRLTASP